MGRCLCSVPWRGDDSEILGLAPKITPVSLQTIVEGSNFDLVMTTSEVCSTFSLSYRIHSDVLYIIHRCTLYTCISNTGCDS